MSPVVCRILGVLLTQVSDTVAGFLSQAGNLKKVCA